MKTRVKEILPGVTVAFSLCFMLLIYAPLELYITNQADFWFTVGQMLPTALLMFVIAFAVIAAVLYAARSLGKKVYDAVLAAELIAVISCYVQGNFLVKNLPGMDGTVVDWGAYPAERIKSLLVWVIAAAAVMVLIKRLGSERLQKFGALGCCALTLILALTLGTLLLTVGLADKENALTATDRDLFEMSEDKNFIILILDAIDADQFDTVLERDSKYTETFSDFTYYDNAMSGYPFSTCSVPFILTSRWYEAEESFPDYVSAAMSGSPFFAGLERENFRTGFYSSDQTLISGMSKERFSNLVDDQPGISSRLFMGKLIAKMTIIKYAPWDLKYLGYDLLSRLPECRIPAPDAGYEYFDWTDLSFYSKIRDDNPITLSGDKCFKFIHIEGAHVPYQYNRDVEIAADGDYWSSIEASITLCGRLFDRMKEAGVYDNSVLVVMADHGYARIEDPRLSTMQQHPILLIKGVGEQHQMQTDSAPVSYEDLQRAYLKLLDGAQSDGIFDWHVGDQRERRFMMYDWTDLTRFEEYIQTGDAGDMETLRPTGKIFGSK